MNDASSTIRPAKCWVHPVETLSHRSHPDRMAQRPDLLYIICWMNGGGRIVYEVSNEFYNKTVEPSGRNVLYLK